MHLINLPAAIRRLPVQRTSRPRSILKFLQLHTPVRSIYHSTPRFMSDFDPRTWDGYVPPKPPTPSLSILQTLDALKQDKWGWVIYRTSFRADLDSSWTRLKQYVDGPTSRQVLSSEAVEKMAWTFVDDHALEKVSPWELQAKFRKWVDETVSVESPNARRDRVLYPDGVTREEIPGSRYRWFIFVDSEALESIADLGIQGGWVNIFDSTFDRSLNSPEDEEDWEPIYGRKDEDLGFKRMAADMVSASFYDELHTNEDQYGILHTRPPAVNLY